MFQSKLTLEVVNELDSAMPSHYSTLQQHKT